MMALWLVRAGAHGEYEEKFLTENKVYLTWENLNHDLRPEKSFEEVKEILSEVYPDASKNQLGNYTGQVWAFSQRISKGDWIAMPSKLKPVIYIAEDQGDYHFHKNGPDPYFHSRKVKWIAHDLPRSNFDQDILYSLGAFLTVCQIQRNDAEIRVHEMANNGWKVPSLSQSAGTQVIDSPSDVNVAFSDLEEIARDQIAKLINAKFKGHGLTRLVDEILKAEGYTTYFSPPGPDKGVDLLAAPGSLGFGSPRICVQVKSTDAPIGREILDQLIGTMQNFQAEQGLLVSWGGFKSSIDREEASQFFRVRLWDQDNLIDNFLRHYSDIDKDVANEIPLKNVWMISSGG